MSLRVGVLLVATGRYRAFLPELLADLSARFLARHTRRVFVFADAPPPEAPADLDVTHVPTPRERWPLPTLRRYHYFATAARELAATDVLFYIDADTRVMDVVDDEVLPDGPSGLVGVVHPCFWGRYLEDTSLVRFFRRAGVPWPSADWVEGPRGGTFETNPASTAFVRPDERGPYFIGCFNGGATGAFLTMAEHIRGNVERDHARGIVALWHDESHLNRYFVDHPPKALSPSYGFPEGWDAPYRPRVVLLAKDHAAMRAP